MRWDNQQVRCYQQIILALLISKCSNALQMFDNKFYGYLLIICFSPIIFFLKIPCVSRQRRSWIPETTLVSALCIFYIIYIQTFSMDELKKILAISLGTTVNVLNVGFVLLNFVPTNLNSIKSFGFSSNFEFFKGD